LNVPADNGDLHSIRMDERPLDDELGEFLKALQRRWYIVLGAIFQFAILAYFLTSLQTPMYTAETVVLLEPSAAEQTLDAGSTNNNGIRGRNVANEILLAKSRNIMEQVSQSFDQFNVGIITKKLKVSGDEASDLLTFTVSDTDPDQAASMANVWAGLYVNQRQQDSSESLAEATAQAEARLADLQTEREDVRADLNQLLATRANATNPDEQNRLDALIQAEESSIATNDSIVEAQINAVSDNLISLSVASDLASIGTARVVGEAFAPTEATNVAPARNLAIGIMLGGIIGLVLVRLLSRRDDRVSTASEVELELNLPVLASIPKAPRALRRSSELALISAEHPGELMSEAFNQLRTSISFMQNSKRRQALIVTSATPGEGKTTTAANIALASALAGTKTMLVDLDLRRPRVHEAFSLPQHPGFSDVVNGDVEIAYANQQFANMPFSVTTAGTPTRNAANLIAGERSLELINAAVRENDLVVLDTPPLLAVADVASIASSVDAVCVVVVRAGATTLADVRETVKRMERVGTEVAGIILTGVKASSASGRSYYGTSEGHGRGEIANLAVMRRPPEPMNFDQVGSQTVRTNGSTTVPVDATSAEISRRAAAARAASSTRTGGTERSYGVDSTGPPATAPRPAPTSGGPAPAANGARPTSTGPPEIKKPEVKRAEPKRAEPKRAEPKRAEPKRAEVKKPEVKKPEVKKPDTKTQANGSGATGPRTNGSHSATNTSAQQNDSGPSATRRSAPTSNGAGRKVAEPKTEPQMAERPAKNKPPTKKNNDR
jgi:capsular exopolysaccharide synthesis family protein